MLGPQKPDTPTETTPARETARSFDPSLPEFPGYLITREISRGGQGVVFEAVQKSTRRKVALKIIKEALLAGPAEEARFEREIRLLAKLNHANIVSIHDSGRAGGFHYYVMDYIEGLRLDEYFLHMRSLQPSSRQPTSGRSGAEAEVLKLFVKICAAVEAAHERGIIHRDLKPGNVRVDGKGEPHILDFGLAKSLSEDFTGESLAAGATHTGDFLGSLPWASPEQACGVPGFIDKTTDVYLLGLMLYRELTGRFPFAVTGGIQEMLNTVATAEPARPRKVAPWMDDELETIILKCLRKDRPMCYRDAGELGRDLTRYLAGEPIEAKPPSFVYIARKRMGSFASQHAVAPAIISIATSVAVALGIASRLFNNSTAIGALVERRLAASWPASASGAMDDVRIVTMTDVSAFDELAKHEGLPDVRSAERQSLRRLHGRFMQRLSEAGVRAVLWDIGFQPSTIYDDDFVRGVQALKKTNAPVVVCVGKYDSSELSPNIAPHVCIGSSAAQCDATKPWRVLLAFQHDEEPAVPSASLCLVDALKGIPGRALFQIDPSLSLVTASHIDQAQTFQKLTAPTEYFRAGRVCIADVDSPDSGVRSGDYQAFTVLEVPSEAILKAATMDYAEIFGATRASLRQRLAHKVIVVGNLQDRNDWHGHPDGRHLPGVIAQATAVAQLMQTAPIAWESGLWGLILVVFGAISGWGAARLTTRRHLVRAVVLLGIGIAICAASLALYHRAHYLINPFIALTAVLLSSEQTVLWTRCKKAIGIH